MQQFEFLNTAVLRVEFLLNGSLVKNPKPCPERVHSSVPLFSLDHALWKDSLQEKKKKELDLS